MKRSSILRFAAILALTGGTFCYLAFNKTSPKKDDSLRYAPTLAITPGYDVQQDFVVTHENFSALSFMFTTTTNVVNKGLLRILLADGERTVYESRVAAETLPREVLYTIRFPAERNSAGKTYRINVTGLPCDDFSGGQHAILVARESLPDCPPVVVNGEKWPYVLYIVPSYSKPLSVTAGLSFALMIALFALWWKDSRTANPNVVPSSVSVPANSVFQMNFDWGMHYFRAFAILSIAVQHYLCLTGYLSWSDTWFMTDPIYFIFISGYLCQYLHYRRPGTPWGYYRKKFANIIVPYVFCSVVTLAIVSLYGFYRPGVISPDKITVDNIPYILAYGLAQIPYWYIPFITVLFIVSPLLVSLRDSTLCALCFVFTVLMVVSEGYTDICTLRGLVSTYCLFTGPYLYGMAFCRFRRTLAPLCRRWVWLALALGIFCGLTIAYNGVFIMPYENKFLVAAVQKIMFTMVALVVLNRINEKKSWIVDQFARLSFTIYFCHMFFLADFAQVKYAVAATCSFLPDLFVMLVICGVYLAFILLFSYLLKVAFGRYSRIFIGS